MKKQKDTLTFDFFFNISTKQNRTNFCKTKLYKLFANKTKRLQNKTNLL